MANEQDSTAQKAGRTSKKRRGGAKNGDKRNDILTLGDTPIVITGGSLDIDLSDTSDDDFQVITGSGKKILRQRQGARITNVKIMDRTESQTFVDFDVAGWLQGRVIIKIRYR